MVTNTPTRVLLVAGQTIDPAAKQAGHRLAYEALNELHESHLVDVVILCNSRIEETEAAAKYASRENIIACGKFRKALAVALGFLSGIPPRFSTRVSGRAIRRIKELVAAHSYSIIWLEFSQAFWLLPRLGEACSDTQRVLSVHDVFSQVVERKSRLERLLFGSWTRRYEAKLFRAASRIRVLSEKDRTLVHDVSGVSLEVEVRRPTLSPFVRLVRRSHDLVRPYSLLFWGAMNRSENRQGLVRFVHRVFPEIVYNFPSTSLLVVGSNPTRDVVRLASARILVTGFVSDPTSYFEVASLGIVPLLSGAGIKLKTLEMLAAGLPVVATPIGAEGVDPSPNLIVTEFANISEAINRYWRQHEPRPETT